MQTMFKDGSVMICGFVARDAEHRSDKAPYTFSVKVGERDTGGDKPDAIWVSCKSWHAYAGQIRKGDTVFAVGKIDTYTNNEGKTYKNLDCEYVAIQGKGGAPAPAPAAAPDADLGDDYEQLFSDDGVPF